MNKSFLLFLIISILSCKSKNLNTDDSNRLTICPADGMCTFEILENKELQIKNDEFNTSYYELNDSKDEIILKFAYSRNKNPQLADDAYSEIVFVQIDKSTTHLELEDDSLRMAKVSFARMCFCRGATGIYPVKKGNYNLIN